MFCHNSQLAMRKLLLLQILAVVAAGVRAFLHFMYSLASMFPSIKEENPIILVSEQPKR